MASQSTYNYGVLPEQAQEDALHASRLLQVEERPFHRVARSLLSKDSLLKWTPRQLPSPPPDDNEEEASPPVDDTSKRQKFREEILLDFAALESSILRIHLIQSSNARERSRYAAEKAKILETAQAVKHNTLELRAQLAEAQRVLELRKGYDELANQLVVTKKLKPRHETQEDIEKLEKEIEELRQESREFEGTWSGRREAFERVVAEGQAVVRLIKGIKEEPEPETQTGREVDEAIEDGEEGTKEGRSRIGTPAPEGSTPAAGGGRTPMPDEGGRGMAEGATPLPEQGGATPERPANKFLDVGNGTRPSSRAGSPSAQSPRAAQEEAAGDVEMGIDEGQPPLEPQPKTTEGMEVVPEEQVATPAEEMDES